MQDEGMDLFAAAAAYDNNVQKNGNMKEIKYWATSYALKADDLYIGFPTKKYLKIDKRDLPTCYENEVQFMYGKILRYFFYLLIKDIIENQVTFKFPPNGAYRAYLEMVPIHGEDFKRAR